MIRTISNVRRRESNVALITASTVESARSQSRSHDLRVEIQRHHNVLERPRKRHTREAFPGEVARYACVPRPVTAAPVIFRACCTCSRSTRNSTLVMSGLKNSATVQSRTMRSRRSQRGIWNR